MALSDGTRMSVPGSWPYIKYPTYSTRWLAFVAQSVLNTGKCTSM